MCQLDQLPTSRCRCTASYFLSCSLLHLICCNLFHLIWCSPCHPLFGCIWRVSTPVPLLTKWQVVGTSKVTWPSFATCPTSLAIPKGWPETPDNVCIAVFNANSHEESYHFISVVVVGGVVQSIFFPCQLLHVSHNVNVVARYRKRLLLCFGHVQCSMASWFLAQKKCIYIARDVSAIVTQINLGSAFQVSFF